MGNGKREVEKGKWKTEKRDRRLEPDNQKLKLKTEN